MANGNMTKEEMTMEVLKLSSSFLEENFGPVLEEGANSRFRFWEYCHEAFLHRKGKALSVSKKGLLPLNLAFFVASWGMYRKSFLTQCDYKVHRKTVEACMKDANDELWDFDASLANRVTVANEGRPCFWSEGSHQKRFDGLR